MCVAVLTLICTEYHNCPQSWSVHDFPLAIAVAVDVVIGVAFAAAFAMPLAVGVAVGLANKLWIE
jgi:hypothetical protein